MAFFVDKGTVRVVGGQAVVDMCIFLEHELFLCS
jgi:hypothetical protein